MEQYIKKSAFVAELNKRLQERKSIKPSKEDDFGQGYLVGRDTEDKAILYFIDTQDVKEVDLEKEICTFFNKNPIPYEHITDWPLLKNCAIHFFELGLKAKKGECGTKIYIIQEDYTCDVEDSFGDIRSENQARITAVATSREDVVKALAHSVFYNHEEYYDVSTRDYQVHEVDVEVGKICFNNKGDFHGFWLTGEEKERVEAMVRELEKQKGEQYGR